MGVLLLVALLACGPENAEEEGPPEGPAGFVVRDSAGIMIATSEGEVAWTDLDWLIDTVPDAVMGTGENTQQTLHNVEGVRGLPDGRLLVVDGGSSQLRFYDRQGRSLYHVAGAGEGPGEFKQPVLLSMTHSDSLLFWDRRLRRFQRFSVDGQVSRVVSLPERNAMVGVLPVGAVDSRVLVRRWDPRSIGNPGPEGPKEEGWRFSWLDLSTGERATVAEISFKLFHRFSGGLTAVPFWLYPSTAVSQDGVLLTIGRSWEIMEFDLKGVPRRVLRIDSPLRPVTAEVLELDLQYNAEVSSLVPMGIWRQKYDEMEVPDSLPCFNALQVDDLGWVWAGVYQTAEAHPSDWMVFDPDGRAHGVVELPVGLEVHHIGQDFILGVWRDDLGVEYVHRYRLERGDLRKQELSGGGSTPDVPGVKQ